MSKFDPFWEHKDNFNNEIVLVYKTFDGRLILDKAKNVKIG